MSYDRTLSPPANAGQICMDESDEFTKMCEEKCPDLHSSYTADSNHVDYGARLTECIADSLVDTNRFEWTDTHCKPYIWEMCAAFVNEEEDGDKLKFVCTLDNAFTNAIRSCDVRCTGPSKAFQSCLLLIFGEVFAAGPDQPVSVGTVALQAPGTGPDIIASGPGEGTPDELDKQVAQANRLYGQKALEDAGAEQQQQAEGNEQAEGTEGKDQPDAAPVAGISGMPESPPSSSALETASVSKGITMASLHKNGPEVDYAATGWKKASPPHRAGVNPSGHVEVSYLHHA